ncbi:protein Aster-B-like isoform X3 [Anneissia japonica]|uniref:protein Aster-B-like isoform X3 n=1 Tax=Anneissia japonica TaxID=1529436 RepID=UPI001425770F|nr:protein Aster-B-like isoform X3 [Anneissia japonica]
MAQKAQRPILPNQRTLLELVEGKETPAGNHENRPTSLPCTASSIAIGSRQADESPAAAVESGRPPGLATSPPSLGSVNMEKVEGMQPKEFDHYPSIRRNASAPINLSSTTGATNAELTRPRPPPSLTSKNSELSDINVDDGSQSGDESIKSDDRSASSSQNGMASSQSVPEYLATDDNVVRKRSPKLGKNKKGVRRSAPWYSVLQSNYKSRCEEFLKLFKGIPETERLTVDYSCAIQKEILVHGRMYVTQNYLCFYANIFKWETTLTIKLNDITAVTKERTVRFIPNALQVTTASEKYFFTSFGSRDKSFMTLFKLWQNSLMDLKMPPTEFWKWIHNNYGDDLGFPEDELPEDYVFPSKDADDSGDDKSRGRVSEGQGSDGDDLSLSESREELLIKDDDFDTEATTKSSLLNKLAPPQIDVSDYSETEEEVFCSCKDQHQGKQYLNEVYDISCDKLFNLLFADGSKFYLDYVKARKSTDINIGKWVTEEESPQETRVITYTFPINSNIGPKSSQVTETQTFHRDLSKEGSCYIAENKVVNKGIPYSDNFHVLGRWCITRVSANKCRLCVNADVCFSKASWLIKNFIEKQVHVGLKSGYIFLGRYLRENLEVESGKRRKTKRRKHPSTKEEENENTAAQRLLKKNISVQGQNTGFLSCLRSAHLNSRPMMLFVCLVLFLLVLVNILLYSQLQHLEQKTALNRNLWSKSDIFEKLDKVPATDEEWRNLIKQQQLFHEEELSKWRDIIGLCVQLMKQMETALEDLKEDIDPMSSIVKLDKYVSDAIDTPESSYGTETESRPPPG